MLSTKQIKGGIYLVVDPAIGIDTLVPRVEQAIKGGVDVLQIWNNWPSGQEKNRVIQVLCELAHQYNIPVLINEEWHLLHTTNLDGFHLDALPSDINNIRTAIGRPFIFGITCGNDLSRIAWAARNSADYISFCSIFPSPSASECEIVNKETVKTARKLTSLPIFVAGGISLSNVEELADTGIDGIALISGIMKAYDVQSTAKKFKEKLQMLKANNNEAITGE